MTFREFIKSTEAIIVVSAFVLIIFFNSKLFAWAGLIAYVMVNIEGGLDKFNRIIKWVVNWFKSLKS